MTDRVTLGVQFDPDAELLDDFEEYKENNGFTSRAETMRHLMREQLHGDPLDDRPDTVLAGLLWDARRDVHKFLIAGVLAFLAGQLAMGLVATGFFVVAGGYGFTVTVAGLDAMLFDSALLRRVTSSSTDRIQVEG
jgi:hypothetical protein